MDWRWGNHNEWSFNEFKGQIEIFNTASLGWSLRGVIQFIWKRGTLVSLYWIILYSVSKWIWRRHWRLSSVVEYFLSMSLEATEREVRAGHACVLCREISHVYNICHFDHFELSIERWYWIYLSPDFWGKITPFTLLISLPMAQSQFVKSQNCQVTLSSEIFYVYQHKQFEKYFLISRPTFETLYMTNTNHKMFSLKYFLTMK